MSWTIVLGATLAGMGIGWAWATVRGRRAANRPRRVERPGMRAELARIDQLEGELAIARRELARLKDRSTATVQQVDEQTTTLDTLRAQLKERAARIEDLEADLAAQRIAPSRIGPTGTVSERRRRKAAVS